MTNRNKRPRIAVEASLAGMVCTRTQASHLLEELRNDYQRLTPERRNQVKTLLLAGFSPSDRFVQASSDANSSKTLIEQFLKSPMEDEKIDEKEIWPAIRYLDPEEQERDKEIRIATIIAILALLLIVGGVWIVLWLRLRQP